MHKKPTIIAAIVSFLLAAVIGIIAIQSDKKCSFPEGDFKRSNEVCDPHSLGIDRIDENEPANRGIKMFAVSEDQTQIAIIPYTEKRIYIYDAEGNYQFSIQFPKTNTSYVIRYVDNILEVIYVHKVNRLIRIDGSGKVIACEGLEADQDSELLRYYENRNQIQVNEWTYYLESQSRVLDFFGLHSKIEKRNTEDVKICVYGCLDSELWLTLYGIIKGLSIWLIFGTFIFCFPFVCINPELVKSYIKYTDKSKYTQCF